MVIVKGETECDHPTLNGLRIPPLRRVACDIVLLDNTCGSAVDLHKHPEEATKSNTKAKTKRFTFKHHY